MGYVWRISDGLSVKHEHIRCVLLGAMGGCVLQMLSIMHKTMGWSYASVTSRGKFNMCLGSAGAESMGLLCDFPGGDNEK